MFGALRAEAPALALELLAASWGPSRARRGPPLSVAISTGLSQMTKTSSRQSRRQPQRRQGRRCGASGEASREPARRPVATPGVIAVSFSGRLRPVLHVGAPPPLDDAIRRDGIDPSRTNRDDPQWLIRQLVAGTPLRAWPNAFGRDPGDLVRLALAAGALGLLEGRADAAEAQSDAGWHEPCSTRGTNQRPGCSLRSGPTAEAAAVAVFRESRRDGWERSWSRSPPRGPPGHRLSSRGYGEDRRTVDVRPLPSLRDLLSQLALVIDPVASASIDVLLRSVEKIPEKHAALRIYWAAPLANFAALVSFRAPPQGVPMTTMPKVTAVVRPHAEQAFADELTALRRPDDRPRPPRWRFRLRR